MTKESAPPGWSYNPSNWSNRLPIVVLAIVGFLIASYLALYQYEVISTVWEPFFGKGSHIILTSHVSKFLERNLGLPITDGALGAFGYFMDAITGLVGGQKRWKSMPWIVLIFGLFIGPLGFVSVMLVIFQPVLLGAWCTLCLATAVISILMIGPAMDEVLASLQYLRRVHDRGHSVWRAFWGLEIG